MVDDDAIRKAELRGYGKGYAAGRRKGKGVRGARQMAAQRQAFLDRAYLALLPAAMTVEGWTFGDKPIRSHVDRVRLACEWAMEALRQRKIV